MPKIKKLSLHEAQKIAAGEVVERPANVVKELVENAIDAGATQISIYLEQAGQQLIRVVDNGCGMSIEDAPLCFEHHATSKITSVNDLAIIASFGFRGEALSAISSVSKTILKTKETSDEQGTEIYKVDGHIKEHNQISCNQGTDITIHDLFYNVPARKKFLKKVETEYRHIIQLFHSFCFSHQHIHFKLHHNGTVVHNCPPVDQLKKRIVQLWEQRVWQHFITIQPKTEKGVFISGAITNHQFYRYDKQHIFFYVNKRWVKNYQLTNALLKGYLNVIPQGKYPSACIMLEIDPNELDINIHPRKEAISFLHPRRIEHIITQTIKQTLEQHLSRQLKKDVSFRSEPTFQGAFGKPFEHKPIASESWQQNDKQIKSIHSSAYKPLQSNVMNIQPLSQSFNNDQLSQSLNKQISSELQPYQLIGQYKKTYVLLEQPEGLFVIDQHAAHERILFEQFAQRFKQTETIKLLFPQIITLTDQELQTLEPFLKLFEQNGIAIEPFGNNQVVVQSCPVHLKKIAFEQLIRETLGIIAEHTSLEDEELFSTVHNKMQAQMACKAAVKAGDELTEQQMNQLIEDLYQTKNRFACPHGRPTGWLLSLNDIEKKFKRKL